MAPKIQKSTKAAPKEEVKEEPAAAAVTVVGNLGPNAGKTVQGMSFLNMLKKNATPEPAKEEEKKPKEAPVLADLPAAAPQQKAKKNKKEPAVVAAPVPEPAPVEEPTAVEAEPEPVVAAPVEEEPVVEEPAVVVEAPVVEAAAPASFNWADAGNDFTQFSSRTEILHPVEPVVEKLAPPAPLVTFRVPFVPTPGLMFVAPSHAMLVQNRLAAVESREQQVLLRETTCESTLVGIAQKEKALADAKAKQADDRDALNRERDAFRLQQQQHQQQVQQQQQQQSMQQQQQQHHHHHHHQPQQQHHYPQQHSSHDVPRNWADEDFMYDTPAPQFRGAPQPNYPRPHHHHQMSSRAPQFGGSGYGQQFPSHQPRMGGAPRMPQGGQPRNMMQYPHPHHSTHNTFGGQESGPW